MFPIDLLFATSLLTETTCEKIEPVCKYTG